MIKYQHDIKIPYELLTDEQKKEICNGCGGKGSWLKPPLRAFFDTDCDHHDYGYWCGNTEKIRKACDVRLMLGMSKDCTELPWYKFIFYYPWCVGYYWMVRRCGKVFFYWGKKKRWPVPTPEQLNRINLLKGLKEDDHEKAT